MKHWYPRNIREHAEKLEANGELNFIKAEIIAQNPSFRRCDLNPAKDTGTYPHLMQLSLYLSLCCIYGSCNLHEPANQYYRLDEICDILELMSLIDVESNVHITGKTVMLAFHGTKFLTIAVEI